MLSQVHVFYIVTIRKDNVVQSKIVVIRKTNILKFVKYSYFFRNQLTFVNVCFFVCYWDCYYVHYFIYFWFCYKICFILYILSQNFDSKHFFINLIVSKLQKLNNLLVEAEFSFIAVIKSVISFYSIRFPDNIDLQYVISANKSTILFSKKN